MKKIKSKKLNSRGQSVAEYAMILRLVATIAVVSLASFTSQMKTSFFKISSVLSPGVYAEGDK